MTALRITALGLVAAAYAAAVLASEARAAMALGLAPLAWIALEACWRLLDPRA